MKKGIEKMRVSFEKAWIVTVRDYFGRTIDRFEMTGCTRAQVREQVSIRLEDYGIGYKATIAPNNSLNEKKLSERIISAAKVREVRERNFIIRACLRKYGINKGDLNKLFQDLEENAEITPEELASFCKKLTLEELAKLEHQ